MIFLGQNFFNRFFCRNFIHFQELHIEEKIPAACMTGAGISLEVGVYKKVGFVKIQRW